MIHRLQTKIISITKTIIRRALDPVQRMQASHSRIIKEETYNKWSVKVQGKCFVHNDMKQKPLISIVLPAFNPELHHFLETVYSVINQHYENWQLIIVNASSDESSRKRIADCALIDTRIVIVETKNKGIASNTNIGLKECRGDYITFLDHDDVLHACALHCVVGAIEAEGAEIVYTDEDKIKADNSSYFDPFLKPKWSPNLFRNVNYLNHLTTIRAKYVHDVGGLRPETDGAQDYDLLLRVIDKYSPKVVHVARILYHWRASETSTAANFSTKSYVLKAGVKALQEHLDRNSLQGVVKAISDRPGFYRIDYVAPKRIDLVVGPTTPDLQRAGVAFLHDLSQYLSSFTKVHVIIGDWAKAIVEELNLPDVYTFSYVSQNQYWRNVRAELKNEVALCLTAGATPVDSEAVKHLVSLAYQTHSITAPVLMRNQIVLDAGFMDGYYGLLSPFAGKEWNEFSYCGPTEWVRDISAISGRVCAARTEELTSIIGSSVDSKNSLYCMLRAGQEAHFVLDGASIFNYLGDLQETDLVNDNYYNPEFDQIVADNVDIEISSWGSIESESQKSHS